jgi:hypothetical protein
VPGALALVDREEKGGYWKVGASLTRCSMMALNFVEPRDSEQYAPVTMQDLVYHLGPFTELQDCSVTVPPGDAPCARRAQQG